ncbi:hypothetical protein AS149_12410 [Burkholderia cenocepacia]|nr:hypothetical protein AS149_12410 [Burkholderia cenocepacia]
MLTVESLVNVLSHPELQVAVTDLALTDATQAALALAARFLPELVLAKLPFDPLHEAYQDLPVTVTWQEFNAARGTETLSEEDAALAKRLVSAMAVTSGKVN